MGLISYFEKKKKILSIILVKVRFICFTKKMLNALLSGMGSKTAESM